MKKEEIVAQLRSYVERNGSQKKAANSLDGVSSATINKMLNGTDWETISEEMWRSVAQQTRTKSEGWQLADTSVHREMTMLLTRAQQDALVAGVIGAAGSGKTETCREYADEHRNVYHITCGEHWNRRTFVSKVLTINDMMEEVVDALSRADNPLLILDEADKLSDQVLYFFITLYNQLEGRCGIVLCGTQYLKARIARGVRLGKKGFEEILSRLGRRFFELAEIGEEDVALVCVANGIESDAKIRKITKESESDLRRVKRSVWAAKNAA